MKIHVMELPPIGTNAMVLLDAARQAALVIDAPEGAYDWACKLAAEAGCRIEGLILTHGHWDHIIDAHAFAEAGIPTYGHAEDRVLFEDPARMASFAIPGLVLRPVAITHWVEGGQALDLMGLKLELRHVPGHCPGNILIYAPSLGAAFVGDVIFAGSVGRYDLPGGDFTVLERSIREQVYTLPEATTLYPGHGPTTTVAQEINGNPFVRPI
jgi:glyoxylase-like metal-dependent hydrolase (beta-lactamase superfamily II)